MKQELDIISHLCASADQDKSMRFSDSAKWHLKQNFGLDFESLDEFGCIATDTNVRMFVPYNLLLPHEDVSLAMCPPRPAKAIKMAAKRNGLVDYTWEICSVFGGSVFGFSEPNNRLAPTPRPKYTIGNQCLWCSMKGCRVLGFDNLRKERDLASVYDSAKILEKSAVLEQQTYQSAHPKLPKQKDPDAPKPPKQEYVKPMPQPKRNKHPSAGNVNAIDMMREAAELNIEQESINPLHLPLARKIQRAVIDNVSVLGAGKYFDPPKEQEYQEDIDTNIPLPPPIDIENIPPIIYVLGNC